MSVSLRSEFILKILCLWCKKFAFIQPDGVSITLQREDLGNELFNIYARKFGFEKKKKKKKYYAKLKTSFLDFSTWENFYHNSIQNQVRIPTFFDMQLKISPTLKLLLFTLQLFKSFAQ